MLNVTDLMVSDLRDTGGHIIKVVRIESFDTTYSTGGILLDPEDFGMDYLEFIHMQGITAYQDSPESAAVIASEQTAMKFADLDGTEYWKMFVFIPDSETGAMIELPDGASLTFPPEMRIVMMVTGA